MATYLDVIPPEIKEHILQYCDGKSIIALGSLSELWSDFILNYNKEVWLDICVKEIKIDYIMDLISALYPKLWMNVKPEWSDIYISWNKWKTLFSNLNLFKLRVYSTHYEITAVKSSGSWIFVGSREGQLDAVNINSGEMHAICQFGPVYDLELKCTTDELVDGIFSGCEHDEIVIRSRYQYLIYNLRNGKQKKKSKLEDFLQLKYFGNREVKIDNIFHSSKVNSSSISKTEASKIQFENAMCSVLQIWNERILLMFDNGTVQVYNYDLKPVCSKINNLHLDLVAFNNRRLVVAHLDVLFFLDEGTSSNILGKAFEVIVGNERRQYRPLPELGAEVTSVLYHAGVLFLGAADGMLYLFEVDSDEMLLSLNLCEPLYSFNVTEDSTSPIVAMSIQEDTHSHFFLAAASISDVYLISSHDLDIFPVNPQGLSNGHT